MNAPHNTPPRIADSRPFFYRCGSGNTAPSGWYQWVGAGLVYLGESLLAA